MEAQAIDSCFTLLLPEPVDTAWTYTSVWAGSCSRAQDNEPSFFSLLQKDLMVLQDIQWVLAVDALTSSHPLSSEEDSIVLPGQISEQFDAISYSKVRRGEHLCLSHLLACSPLMGMCFCGSSGCGCVEDVV